MQTIRGAGTTFRHVSFVRRGKKLGLLLNPSSRRLAGGPSPPPDGVKGDMVFDFAQRSWAADPENWTSAPPAEGEWRAQSCKIIWRTQNV